MPAARSLSTWRTSCQPSARSKCRALSRSVNAQWACHCSSKSDHSSGGLSLLRTSSYQPFLHRVVGVVVFRELYAIRLDGVPDGERNPTNLVDLAARGRPMRAERTGVP